MEGDREPIELEGDVVSIVYQNGENGYTVLRLATPEGVATAVGCMPGVAVGETLLLHGQWGAHQSYGEQFKAERFERRQPQGAEAVFKYLASGAIRGIGPARARSIVDRFGAEALSVIENEPERLSEVGGISARTAREIGAWYRRHMGLRLLIEFLAPFQIPAVVAMRLYRVYGDEGQAALRQNPYILCTESYGAEFFEADKMAEALGFETDCPERVEAAVIFEMAHNLRNGHVFLPREKLIDATNRLIDIGHDAVAEAIDVLCDAGLIVREPIAGVDGCYLAEVYEAERLVSDRLTAMAGERPEVPKRLDAMLAQVQRSEGVRYAPAQLDAVRRAADCQVMVLTGGPGTGKTTAVRGILALFDAMGLDTLLCAPTGRAAKRMSELCLREASTIHRTLGAAVGEDDALLFDHDGDNPLRAEAIIVDEASMIDLMLMRALLAATPKGCRLVLVGDADQLPPVGPGQVFADIIRSDAVPIVVLTEIFRQAEESRIVRNAHRINSGGVLDLAEQKGDFFFLQRAAPERIAETVTELCAQRLPKNMGLDPGEIQVLSPTRKNEAGTERLNALLQAALNPPADGKREKKSGNFVFREGDKVMQIRNDYDIMWKTADGTESGAGVYNGDIGRITAIDFREETVTVDYEDKLVTYGFEQLSELEPAYAMTVHKAQGSEYKAVVLAVAPGVPNLLVRSVLYTAVTRARELLVLVGDREVVQKMVENDRRLRRYSGLRARLAQ